MKSRKMARLLASLVVAVIFLVPTACTKGPDTTPTGGTEPKYGGILHIEGRTDPVHFDPHYNRAWHFAPCVTSIFNNLVCWDPHDPNAIIPELAERYEVASDRLSVTFYLRQGVKWHDGQPFTAADVKFSLQRMADASKSTEISKQMQLVVAGIDIIDDHTVKVRLKQPSASFLAILSGGPGAMQAAHVADQYERTDTRRLVGTGPFEFKEYIPGNKFEVVKNPDYWDKGRPYLDGIISYVIPAEDARIAALVSGRLDITHPVSGVRSIAMLEEWDKHPEIDYLVEVAPSVNAFEGQFKDGHPWNDVRVRKAFSLVLDREAMFAAFSGTPRLGAAGAYLCPGSPWAVSEVELNDWLELDKPYETRVAEATKLLADAGYANGFTAGLMLDNSADYVRMASVIADTLQTTLNVKLNLEVMEEAELVQREVDRNYDFILRLKLSSSGDPSDLLGVYWVTGATGNYSGYSNPELDAAHLAQDSEFDPVKRAELTKKAERILMEDYPDIAGIWRAYGYAYRVYLKGETLKMVYGWRYANFWLDK